MQTFSKRITRFLSLASISILLAFSFSCKKETVDPLPIEEGNPDNEGNTLQPLIATADVNFVDEGNSYNLECYNTVDYIEVGYMSVDGDTSFVLAFNQTDKYGNKVGDNAIAIVLTRLRQGETYTLNDYVDLASVYASSNIYETSSLQGTAEVTITSVTNSRVTGTFEFTAYSQYDPTDLKVTVSNGVFDSKKF